MTAHSIGTQTCAILSEPGSRNFAVFPDGIDTKRMDWPPFYRWLSICRDNALRLFPKSAYTERRLDHRLLGKPIALVNDPSSIKEICGRSSKNFRIANVHRRMLEPAFGDGLIVAEGNTWAQQRRMALKLTRKKAHHFESAIIERIDEFLYAVVAKSDARDFIDPSVDIAATCLDLISRDLFGYYGAVSTHDAMNIISEHRLIVENIDVADLIGLPPWLRTPRMIKSRKKVQELDNLLQVGIRKWHSNNSSHLMPEKFPVRDFVVSMLAGYESLTALILWSLLILSFNKIYQKYILSNPNNVRNFVLELVRFYPPLPFIYRQCIRPTETNVGHIPQGTLVCISPWVIHHHEELWLQPNEFSPDRWSGIESWPECFIPFGTGARQCVGSHYSLRLIELFIRRVAEKIEIKSAHTTLPEPRGSVSLRPDSQIMLSFIRKDDCYSDHICRADQDENCRSIC